MKTLDAEIGQILGLVGLLLVFVVGYFTALLPRVDEEIGRQAPSVQADMTRMVRRLAMFRNVIVGFLPRMLWCWRGLGRSQAARSSLFGCELLNRLHGVVVGSSIQSPALGLGTHSRTPIRS